MNSCRKFVTKDMNLLYLNFSVFVLKFHLCGFELYLCVVQLEKREGDKERVKEGEKKGEVGGEESGEESGGEGGCTLHLTLAANGSVVCTAALCTALTGGMACDQHSQSIKTAKHVHTSSTTITSSHTIAAVSFSANACFKPPTSL